MYIYIDIYIYRYIVYYTIYPRSISIVSPIAALVAFQDLAHSCAAGWGWGSTLKSGWGFRWEDAGFMANHAGRCFMSVEPDEFWVSFGCFNAWVGCPEKKFSSGIQRTRLFSGWSKLSQWEVIFTNHQGQSCNLSFHRYMARHCHLRETV